MDCAISILLVILGHLSGTRGFGRITSAIGDYAHLGVVIFFVISGFLITSLLLAEHRKRGSVSISLFYARRAVRIFPAAFLYLAILACLCSVGITHLNAKDFCYALTYTVNYCPRPSWEIGHLWSLSVEEQFYLLWPFAFVSLGPKRAIWAAAAFVVLGPVARAVAWMILRGTPCYDLPMFPMVADSIAMGCLLAKSRAYLEEQRWYLKLFHPVVSILLAVMVMAISRYQSYTAVSVLGTSISNLFLAILIHRAVYCCRDVFGRLLNWKPFATIGVLSYSLYIWQQLFINRNSSAVDERVPAESPFGGHCGYGILLPARKTLAQVPPTIAGLIALKHCRFLFRRRVLTFSIAWMPVGRMMVAFLRQLW